MQDRITHCLWFSKEAEVAMNYYTSIFSPSKKKTVDYTNEGKVMSTDFELMQAKFVTLNGNSMSTFNPSINFFVCCESKEELDQLYANLVKDGEVMMPLDSYDWSDYYLWLNDKYGVSWQLMKDDLKNVGQKITPLFFFSGKQRGKAKEAMDFYLSIFSESKSEGAMFYSKEEGLPETYVKHAQAKLLGHTFMFMDSGVENDFPFNESVSIMIHTKDQAETDYYWEKLLQNGGEEMMCGWLKDQFGVCWQVIPDGFREILTQADEIKREKAMQAMMQMKKLDINQLNKI